MLLQATSRVRAAAPQRDVNFACCPPYRWASSSRVSPRRGERFPSARLVAESIVPAHGVDPDRLTSVELQLARLEERTVPSCTRAQILCRLRTSQGAVGGAFRVVAVGSPVTLSIDVGSEQPAEGGLDVRGAVFNDTATAATAVGRGIHTGKKNAVRTPVEALKTRSCA